MDVFTPAQEARIRAIVEEMTTKTIILDKDEINAALQSIGVPRPPAGGAQTPPDTRTPGT